MTHPSQQAMVGASVLRRCLQAAVARGLTRFVGRETEIVALAHARAYQERGHQAYALCLLGEIAAQRDSPEREQAKAHYRQALALAEELGMRPLQAHYHRDLGTLYAKIGRYAETHTELSTAIAMYRAMEMTFWPPQAEATLAQFAELGTPFRLGDVTQTTDTLPADYLTRLSAAVLNREPPLETPERVRQMPGDIILALSDGDFICTPVAIRRAGGGGHPE